ncbi:hypothetical protein B4135_1576 [Caldibacillus debilis]|uniref:Uncharacterized protein n=1 Tax=Caldibacillus debilis TaxID=301148 RepID=A0A150MBM0_9BACI|nr:hypothetical protein B4135_1576 [Caldibacillus debilis]
MPVPQKTFHYKQHYKNKIMFISNILIILRFIKVKFFYKKYILTDKAAGEII